MLQKVSIPVVLVDLQFSFSSFLSSTFPYLFSWLKFWGLVMQWLKQEKRKTMPNELFPVSNALFYGPVYPQTRPSFHAAGNPVTMDFSSNSMNTCVVHFTVNIQLGELAVLQHLRSYSTLFEKCFNVVWNVHKNGFIFKHRG